MDLHVAIHRGLAFAAGRLQLFGQPLGQVGD
jgi:hypothetical protein